MDTNERVYKYNAILNIKRSHVLDYKTFPKDDIVPWLFLILEKKEDKKENKIYTFFYKIEQPLSARYEIPFNINLAFMIEEVGEMIELNKIYDVWRGEEYIGEIKIIQKI